MYAVELAKPAKRFLKKCPFNLNERSAEKVEELRICPIPSDAKRLVNLKLWRVRVGDYRILYEVDHVQKRIGIEKIDHRSRIYD